MGILILQFRCAWALTEFVYLAMISLSRFDALNDNRGPLN